MTNRFNRKKSIKFGKPLISNSEKKLVNKTLSQPILAHGTHVKKFEKLFSKFTKSKYAISVSSCTAGLQLALFNFGIGKGDEVIVPSQTHVATAHSVELNGAKPIFVDCNLFDGNINTQLIEKKINTKTKAILVAHFIGLPVFMKEIIKISKKYNLKVIEDCATALGSYIKGRHVGNFGDCGVFSFYPVKHITTGEGGMIITNNHNLAKKFYLNRAFGVNRNFQERKLPAEYDVIDLGFNFRMSEINAAIGIEQIKKINFFLKKRKSNFDFLKKNILSLKNTQILDCKDKNDKSSFYALSVLFSGRLKKYLNQIKLELKEKFDIGTSVYYPKPVPEFKFYKKKYFINKSDFKNSRKISYGSICFSVGPHLNKKDMIYTFNCLKTLVEKFNK